MMPPRYVEYHSVSIRRFECWTLQASVQDWICSKFHSRVMGYPSSIKLLAPGIMGDTNLSKIEAFNTLVSSLNLRKINQLDQRIFLK
jgi:hypothetical protein